MFSKPKWIMSCGLVGCFSSFNSAAEDVILPWLDTVQTSVSDSLNNTAQWFDEYFVEEECVDSTARAWGRISVGWEPKKGDYGDFPVKFRLKMRLPNLKNKVDLILSDNELDDFERLPLEASRPHDDKSNSDDFSAAIRLIHKSSKHSYFASRIGLGGGTVYGRSMYRWQDKISENWNLKIEPALEYYIGDGFGARLQFDATYTVNPVSELKLVYSVRDREDFEHVRWKQGAFYVHQKNNDTAYIWGAIAKGEIKPRYQGNEYTTSVRWRQRSVRKWLFIEIEPFIDFMRENDFDPEPGLALRVEGFFGYKT